MNTIIVSPSGNFYGSEQVLYNFLNKTSNKYRVYVPKSSVFYYKLKELQKHRISGFKSLPWLYFKLCLKVLAGGLKSIYINEGGHIKYAKLLAKIAPKSSIILHIRLLEDCESKRLGVLPSNVKLIGISDFISHKLTDYPHSVIYDPIDVNDLTVSEKINRKKQFTVGIVGRVSETKGVAYYEAFFNHIFLGSFKSTIEFHFFGDVIFSEEVSTKFYETFSNKHYPVFFRGFVQNQDELFGQLDLVLHLNPNEPLGRVGLESWSRGIPFVCFNSGGTGEINKRLGLESFSIDVMEGWEDLLKNRIEKIMKELPSEDISRAKKGIIRNYGSSRYVSELENHFKY
ncbi:glycosyltransferase [Mongoliitalea lutea]|uniref:Glycosyl transferase family 1 domain-containing protein n=1 Tax=Mongoliitalea lutea TaxID=849756 RepID=A0A8J3G5M1_9BACT|nr:glycosyltransferase [Mongoliitalea lutea]GHB37114.1 hypothetical protein GCM10008106_18000 [Mongoliitalea lutea]